MNSTRGNLTDSQQRVIEAVGEFVRGKPKRLNGPAENPKPRPRTAARLARMVQQLAADLRAGADRELVAQQLDGLQMFFKGLRRPRAADGSEVVA